MASEIRVDKINSLSGVGTVTLSPTGVDIAGITTVATFKGSTGTFTGDVDIADKIVHTGDTNTAIRFPSADTITAETGGSERLRIDSSGKTGIGTDNSQNKFHVVNSDFQVARFESSSATDNGSYLELYANSPSPADDDILGIINFKGNNDGASNSNVLQETTFAQVRGYAGDVTDASEDGYLTFNTRAAGTFAERVRITSAGLVGIGTDNPDQILECSKSSGTTLIKAAVGGNSRVGFEIEKTGSTTQTWRIQDGQSGNGILEVYDQTDSRSVMTFGGTGNVTIGAGNLIMGTAGKGIDFSAQTASSATGATATAEVLDHYEEGTWTPNPSGGGTISGTSISYAGTYTRIGRVVYCHINISNSAGDIQISSYKTFTGLPFSTLSGSFGTGRVLTEDGEITARQGDIVAGNDAFLINASGSSSGTVSLRGSFFFITS